MPNETPLAVEEILAEERRALRPDEGDRPLSALCISGGGIRSATESYGSLGLLTIEEICQGWEGDSLESLVEHVETAYLASA
jgi:hypothetical protein